MMCYIWGTRMILTRPVLRKIVREVLEEISEPTVSHEDEAGDEMIMKAMGDDVMAFIDGLPDDQKVKLLSTFMDILKQQHPEIEDSSRG